MRIRSLIRYAQSHWVKIAAAFALITCVVSLIFMSQDYAYRNGAEEAYDDIEAMRPPKLYSYTRAQIGLTSISPGVDCRQPLPKVVYQNIPEAANWAGPYATKESLRRGEAARAFAYLYNMVMLDAYRHEWKRSCPDLHVSPYFPER
jgi:hypothetical protein